MASSMTSIPMIRGKCDGREAAAMATMFKEPGWFSDGQSSVLVMYLDKPEPMKWVPKDQFMADPRTVR